MRSLLVSMTSWLRTRQNSSGSIPQNISTHIGEVRMDVFITCLIDRVFNGLIKYGHAKEYDILRAWEYLYGEYMDALGETSYRRLMSIIREVGQLESRKRSIEACIQCLRITYSLKCVSLLRGFGYDYTFSSKDKDSLLADVTRVEKKARTLNIVIAQKMVEYTDMKSEMKEGGELTREYFTEIFVVLSKYMGYHIVPSEIVVSEYAVMKKMYVKETERTREMIEKTQGHGVKGRQG
jgi:hypothetical protein